MPHYNELTPEQKRFLENKTTFDLDQAWAIMRDNLDAHIVAFEALEEMHPPGSDHDVLWSCIRQAMATALLQALKYRLDNDK